MTDRPRIIRNNRTLTTSYQQLKKNDIICGRIRLSPGEEHVLTDLLQRGVHLIPSATAQLASRSKTFQARIFIDFMVPGTLPIYDSHALLAATSSYRRQQHGRVVLKHDRKNGGLGVHLFNDIEEIYNYASIGSGHFPFIIQPYQSNSRDIRVILLDGYVEAYERVNPYNFRKNLHCGGDSTTYPLSELQLEFCHKVMRRGDFAYAHLDLLLTDTGNCYLTEINLRGGLKGSRMSGKEYLRKIDMIHERLIGQHNVW